MLEEHRAGEPLDVHAELLQREARARAPGAGGLRPGEVGHRHVGAAGAQAVLQVPELVAGRRAACPRSARPAGAAHRGLIAVDVAGARALVAPVLRARPGAGVAEHDHLDVVDRGVGGRGLLRARAAAGAEQAGEGQCAAEDASGADGRHARHSNWTRGGLRRGA